MKECSVLPNQYIPFSPKFNKYKVVKDDLGCGIIKSTNF